MCTSYMQATKHKGDIEMGIRQKIAQFAAYQRTVRELSALDNRQLQDLGIYRGEIRSIARARTI